MKEQNFKQTEIGKIPVDWEILKLQEICNFQNGVGHEQFESENGKYIVVNSKFISTESKVKRFCDKDLVPLLKNDITIVMSDIPNGKALAKCYIIEKDNCYSLNQRIGRIVITEMSAKFYFYYLNRNKYFISFDSGSGQTNLRKQEVLDCPIILPPLAEQEKIAEVLSDTDFWIESTEALLAKKRQIKKGAMQKLLSLKEDWEVAELKDVAWFQEGPGLRNWQFTDSGMKVINVTNLENGYLNLSRTKRYISLQEFDRMYKHFEIQENDIVVASSGNSYGKIAVVREKDLPLVMNTSVIRFKPLEKIDYNFLLVFLKSVSFKDQIDLLTTGGAQPNFGPAHLNKILVNLPPKNEQKNIADVILSMDLEIESLENRLQKARQLKQGMMQDLLTGKVRLV